MKNLRSISLFFLIIGAGTLILKLFDRRPLILNFLGDALDPVAIGMAAIGAVLLVLSFLKFKKKELAEKEPAAKNDTEEKKDE
jgi:mannose/fructose/N-acetylgalactosamine-specific phosphotransferase system component IIC